jgi:hypothetical protein
MEHWENHINLQWCAIESEAAVATQNFREFTDYRWKISVYKCKWIILRQRHPLSFSRNPN